MFFFLGRYDLNTPSKLAADYLGRLRAPLKGLVWFEQSAHFPFFEEPAEFHREMVRADSAVKKTDDLVKLSKERKVTVALAGYGTNSHIVAAMFANLVKPKQMVIIPCTSSTESMLQVVGGHTDFCVTSTGGAVFKMVEEGKLSADQAAQLLAAMEG